MRILITGICGFVGSELAKTIPEHRVGVRVVGIDNLSRTGSETNLARLKELNVDVRIGDIRNPVDLAQFGAVDWVIDAAANPSVLAGVDGKTSATELLDQNLFGTIPILEYCRKHQSAFTLLSTSRVYSINALRSLPLAVENDAYVLSDTAPSGEYSSRGIKESFSVSPPLSLYGVSKLCSEQIALEYGCLYEFPVWINRCGVMAGSGQFGNAEQGIFSFWIRNWQARKPLKYLGFDGTGRQVRDCLHPKDLVPLLLAQFEFGFAHSKPHTLNISGGIESAMSLAQLSEFCRRNICDYAPIRDGSNRQFDIPWVVLDNSAAKSVWNWSPSYTTLDILNEILANPN